MTSCTRTSPRVGWRAAATGWATLIATVAPAIALAQHAGDIALTLTDDAIVTGFDRGDGLSFPVVVIPAVFGDTGIDHFTSNPGFDAPPGTFAPNSHTGFNILAPLLAWSGTGFDAAAGESITISFSSLEVTTGDGFVPGFGLLVSGSGAWHRHLNFTLNGPGGNDPAPGVYLLELELWNGGGGIESSDPFWIVFKDGVSDEVHDAAMAWMDAATSGGLCADASVVHRGLTVSGGHDDLCESDDARWSLRPDVLAATLVAPVNVELLATSPDTAPSSITFNVEVAASAPGVHLRIELYNAARARWESTLVLDLPEIDTEYEVTRLGNAAEFVDTDGRVRARLAAFRPLGVPPMWNVSLDRARWRVK